LTKGVNLFPQSEKSARAARLPQHILGEFYTEEIDDSPASVEPENHNRPLVLVVEDNVEMCRFIAESLNPHYRVVTARNGREGIEKARSLRPDLILSDMMMPVMSGEDMVREIRQQSRELDHTPIVLLTAKADEHSRVELLRHGAQDYITTGDLEPAFECHQIYAFWRTGKHRPAPRKLACGTQGKRYR